VLVSCGQTVALGLGSLCYLLKISSALNDTGLFIALMTSAENLNRNEKLLERSDNNTLCMVIMGVKHTKTSEH